MLLVPATLDGRVLLAAMSRGARGVAVRSYRTIDGRSAGDVSFEATSVDVDALVGGQSQGRKALDCAVANGCIAVAGEAAGLMETLLTLTRDYLRVRKQFGVPLSRFQALQHRAADMLVGLQQTRSITLYAAHLRGTPESARAAAAAKAYAGEAARAFAHAAVQLHGAMGMVDETPAAHFAKRLALIHKWLGSSAYHLGERIASDAELT
jgi:alkylation response protein AidB-like acyl-CoA dehydrogenase